MDNIDLNSIKAKRSSDKYQTLSEHTEWVVNEAMKLIDETTLQAVSQQTGFSKDWIKELIFFSAYFHDIGKATKEFQSRVNGEREKKAFHSLYSFNLTYEISLFDLKFEDGLINFLSLVVLTHHTIYRNDIFNTVSKDFSILKETKEFFFGYKNLYFEFFNSSPPNLEFPENFDYDLDEIKEGIRYFHKKENFRTLYFYVSGILNLADWIASAKFDGKEFDFSQKKEKLEFTHNLRDFQKELSEITSSAIVEIPTGEGKTEGSLFWALHNLRDKNSKIIYTLPTQTTSNKLFQRVEKLFGDVGLVHSSAKSYLEDFYRNESGEIEWATPYIFTKNFSQPVTVSTLDALLKNFANIGRYNITSFNYLNSVVIIDEVHSYDFKMLGFLKKFLEVSEKFGVKVLLMSASIPNILKKRLNVEQFPLVTDVKLFEKVANRIEKKDQLLENSISEILRDFQNKKRVLVIANTIKKATDIFKSLDVGSENKILFHSQFKKIDRAKKEGEIFEKLDQKEPFILVATQLVEISLDIDFEVLFTEIAPIDSLIQRFGRVNRTKNQNKLGDIFIYKTLNPKPYEDISMKYAFEIIENGIFPISKYVKWLNLYYETLLEKDTKFQIEFEDKFNKGYKKQSEVIEKAFISETRDYGLRDIEKPKEDFLLIDDFESEKAVFENTISLPTYFSNQYLYSNIDIYAKRYWKTLNLKYNYELGVIFEKHEDWNEIW